MLNEKSKKTYIIWWLDFNGKTYSDDAYQQAQVSQY